MARRQGDLADRICPFKLTFDDGQERFACLSALDRVHWVRQLWDILDSSKRLSRRSAGSAVSRGSNLSGTASALYNLRRSRRTEPPARSLGLETTDDTVVVTAGGLPASLVHRNSRKLAASSAQRTRSLRRVASATELQAPPPVPSLPQPLRRDHSRSSRDLFTARESTPAQTTPSTMEAETYRTVPTFQPAPYPASASRTDSGPLGSDQATPRQFAAGGITPLTTYPTTPTIGTYAEDSRSPVSSGPTFGTPGLFPSDSVSNVGIYSREYSYALEPRPSERTPSIQPPTSTSMATMPTATARGSASPVSERDFRTAPQTAAHTPTTYRSARDSFEPSSDSYKSASSMDNSPPQPTPLKRTTTISASPSSWAIPPSPQLPQSPRSGITLRTALRALPKDDTRPSSESSAPTHGLADPSGFLHDSPAPSVGSRHSEPEVVRYQLHDNPVPSSSSRPTTYATALSGTSSRSIPRRGSESPGGGSFYASVPMSRATTVPQSSNFDTAFVPLYAGEPYSDRYAGLPGRSTNYTSSRGGHSNGNPSSASEATPGAQHTQRSGQSFVQDSAGQTLHGSAVTASQYTTTRSSGNSFPPSTAAPGQSDTTAYPPSTFISHGSSDFSLNLPPTISDFTTPFSPGRLSTVDASTRTYSSPSGSEYSSVPPVPISRSSVYTMPSIAPSTSPQLRAEAPSFVPRGVPSLASLSTNNTDSSHYASASGLTTSQFFTVHTPSTLYGKPGSNSSYDTPGVAPSTGYVTAPSPYSWTTTSGQYNTPSQFSSQQARSQASGYTTTTFSLGVRSCTPLSEPDTNYTLLAALDRQSSAGSYVSMSHFRRNQNPPPTSTGIMPSRPESLGSVPVSNAAPRGRRKAVPPLEEVSRAVPAPLPSSDPSSSTSSTKSKKTYNQPMRPASTPPSSSHGSGSSFSSSSSSRSSSYSSTTSTSTALPGARDFSMLRLVNYLEGQEQTRTGQTSRMTNQLDRVERSSNRIEHKLDRVEGKLSRLDPMEKRLAKLEEILKESSAHPPIVLSDAPPPVPSKDGHSRDIDEDADVDSERPPSPALSDTSSSSSDTERPVTPTATHNALPFVMPELLSQRLDDVSNLLGTVLGRTKDIQDQLAEKRESAPATHLENMVLEILHRLNTIQVLPEGSIAGSVYESEMEEGGWYSGNSAIGSDMFDRRRFPNPPPPTAVSSSSSAISMVIPESLLNVNLGQPSYDYSLEPDLPVPDRRYQGFRPEPVPEWLRARHRQHDTSSVSTPVAKSVIAADSRMPVLEQQEEMVSESVQVSTTAESVKSPEQEIHELRNINPDTEQVFPKSPTPPTTTEGALPNFVWRGPAPPAGEASPIRPVPVSDLRSAHIESITDEEYTRDDYRDDAPLSTRHRTRLPRPASVDLPTPINDRPHMHPATDYTALPAPHAIIPPPVPLKRSRSRWNQARDPYTST